MIEPVGNKKNHVYTTQWADLLGGKVGLSGGNTQLKRELLSQQRHYGKKGCATQLQGFTSTPGQSPRSPEHKSCSESAFGCWVFSFFKELMGPKAYNFFYHWLVGSFKDKGVKSKASGALLSRDHSEFPSGSLMNTFMIHDHCFSLSWHTYKPGIIQFPIL